MKRYVFLLQVCIALVFMIGLMMVFNTSAAEVIDRSLERSTHDALIKQILYAFVGLIGAAGVSIVGYRTLLKITAPLLFLGTLLLLLVLIPGIGQELNGARRWLRLFGYSFQPSEFVKYLIPMYYIKVITEKGEFLNIKGFLQVLGILAIPIGLIFMEPDNGSVLFILIALIALFILSRLKWTYWALPLGIFALCGGVIALQMPHVSSRLEVYLNPELDLQGRGHQPHQAKIAAGSGKLFGRGPTESLQKLTYLPEARNDYIAAIYAEEYGFIGILGLLSLYMMVGYLGFYISANASDLQGFYLGAILTFYISFQAFFNLGVVSGLLPSKGTNLPFFSQGGSSLLAHFIILSLILNIAKFHGFKRVSLR
jgi:cell division protein FtsW